LILQPQPLPHAIAGQALPLNDMGRGVDFTRQTVGG